MKQKKSRPFTVGFRTIRLFCFRGKQSGWQYVDVFFVVTAVPEVYLAVYKGVNRMIFAYSGIVAGFENSSLVGPTSTSSPWSNSAVLSAIR